MENSVTRVTFGHHEACQVMPNSYPEWRNFHFALNDEMFGRNKACQMMPNSDLEEQIYFCPHQNNRETFFFLHTHLWLSINISQLLSHFPSYLYGLNIQKLHWRSATYRDNLYHTIWHHGVDVTLIHLSLMQSYAYFSLGFVFHGCYQIEII